jgi:hypothetical protein
LQHANKSGFQDGKIGEITMTIGLRNGNAQGQKFAIRVPVLIIAALVVFGSGYQGAHGGMGGEGVGGVAASQTAQGGLAGCSNNHGKALYDCVANVLDRLRTDISGGRSSDTQRALQTAAFQLRAATTKVQALSAITQCRSVVAAVLRQVATGGGDSSGLNAIAGVLAQAAKLIQTKG